jgi:hypothetical protein
MRKNHDPADDRSLSVYQQLVNLKEFSSALYDISNDIETAQELIAKCERNQTFETHMQAGLALSGLEIKMTNFAQALRERFQ